ncbi:MAG: hypothetical protein JNK48_06980 [Bryobacterales bacterium]|nr:hypothetical protein [Bryobacterales bacterium]
MRLRNYSQIVVCFLIVCALVFAQGMPKMSGVEPATVKVSGESTVSGENLDKSSVSEVYLTDGKDDVKLPIVQQTAASIKFRVPAGTKPGRYSLMLLTAGADPKLIEQPVKLTVE